MFMQNAWYAAALASEVGRKLLARRICNQSLVIYRLEDGSPVALHDLCCHRLLPLSHGWLEGDLLVCGYHGLTFDRSGTCVRVPSQERIGRNLKVRQCPAVERYGFVWVWIGDPAMADPDAVPDIHWNTDPAWTSISDVIPIACDYRLLIDNLLDLTHETYVHPTSLGHRAIPGSPIETMVDGDLVTVSRWIMDHEPAPFWGEMMRRSRGYTGRCDRWQICNFVAPCNVVLHVGMAEVNTGARQGDLSHGISGMVLNMLTPATSTTCWYFWAFARNFCREDAELSRQIKGNVDHIFDQDKKVVEAQQRAMLENPDVHGVNINIDEGRVRVWRMIEARSQLRQPTVAA